MQFHRIYISPLLFTILLFTLLCVTSKDNYAQIAVKAQKTIPITDGPRLSISKRKKVKALKNTNKLTQSGGKVTPNFRGQSRFKGAIRLNKVRRKNQTAAFRGNIKNRSNGSSYDIARKYRGTTKMNRGYSNPTKRYRGNVTVARNRRRTSLNKLKPIYLVLAPLRGRGNAIKRYSGEIKLRKIGGFRHSGSQYRGDIKIKKNRLASRRQARYHGGPVNPLDRAKYRNQLIKNSRRKDGQYGKRPKKRNRKKVKLKYDTREGRIWRDDY